MRSMAAFEIRRLHRKIAQLDRRVGLVDLGGKVKPGSQDMKQRTVVLVLGQTVDGKDILSPPVRWQGTGAGALKMHAVPADSEQMTLHSPSGTIGTGSMAHWGTFDKDNPPPSQSKDEAVLQFGGKAQITFGKDFLKLAYAEDQDITIKDKTIVLRVPDSGGMVDVGDPDKGGLIPVKLVTGQAKNLQAKMG